ncbi:MAG: pentapeptide repeat-containing protein, partial [Mucilaginibacter sp.]
MLIEIKNRVTGEVIFSHEQENNTMKITLGLAVESKADLRYANLSSADLSSADLSSADLSSA